MTSSLTNTVPARVRHLVLAALFAAATALTCSTFADPATASATPEWDIGRYDDCMKNPPAGDPSEQIAWTRKCCLDSGGEWNDSLGKCQAPPANPAQAPSRLPPGVDIQTATQVPPVPANPGITTQTLAPGPATVG